EVSTIVEEHVGTSFKVVLDGVRTTVSDPWVICIGIHRSPVIQLVLIHGHPIIRVEGFYKLTSKHHGSLSYPLQENAQIETAYLKIIIESKSIAWEWAAEDNLVIIINHPISIDIKIPVVSWLDIK